MLSTTCRPYALATLLLIGWPGWSGGSTPTGSSRLIFGSNGQPPSRPRRVSSPGQATAPASALPKLRAQALEDDETIETRTLLAGEASRRPGEADSTFVRRVLPLSFAESHDLLAAAWRPSAYGRQLFFSRPSHSEANEQGSDLVVLDPFYENSYAVHVFLIPALNNFIIASQGKATTLTAIFFADVNQDGRKELLALSQGGILEPEGFMTHYQTQVFHYLGPTSRGYPQYYEDDALRQSLAELATVAEVRQALAQYQPQRRASKHALPNKPARK